MGVWGRAPSGVQGQSPWSRGQGALEAESILVIGCPTEPANLAPFQKCLALQRMNGLTVDLSALRKTSANNIETQSRRYHVTKVEARHIGEPRDHKSGGLEPLGPLGVYAYDVMLWRPPDPNPQAPP